MDSPGERCLWNLFGIYSAPSMILAILDVVLDRRDFKARFVVDHTHGCSETFVVFIAAVRSVERHRALLTTVPRMLRGSLLAIPPGWAKES
jgi:hypothetical protein